MEIPERSLPPRGRLRPSDTAHDRRAARSVLPKADRHRAIAVAAYYRAERRGFLAGGDLADWLAAEREVDGWSDEHS